METPSRELLAQTGRAAARSQELAALAATLKELAEELEDTLKSHRSLHRVEPDDSHQHFTLECMAEDAFDVARSLVFRSQKFAEEFAEYNERMKSAYGQVGAQKGVERRDYYDEWSDKRRLTEMHLETCDECDSWEHRWFREKYIR